jgi:hypothetical protein
MPVEVETPQVTLQGNGWINVRAIRLAGSTLDLPLRWSNDETWQVDVPLRQGTQEVVLQAFDHQERMVGSAAISVSSTVDNPLAEQLRLTELNYHPHDPTPAELAQLPTLDDNDFEFIELYNAGDQPLYLDQVKFTEGVDLTFKDVVLAAGEVAVIVSNEAAFRARYGNDPRVIGEFNTSALSNAGEQLTLVAADGTVLIRFAYDDAAPWTPLADGQGHTLELIDVVGTPSNELGQASVWRASVGVGGSPGSIQLSTLPGDLNQDQQVDVTDLTLLCFAIRTQSESIDLNNDGVTNHDDLAYLVESILDTQFGDVNLDGRFDSRDLVLLFQRGHYHDAVPLNSGWADGDWNCDGEFTSSDLVLALQRGPYETGEARRARKPL